MTKELKVEFAPGCFDSFEGTQEELDELQAEILAMFAGKTSEELEAMSRAVDDDTFDELPEEVQMQIFNAVMGEDTKRNLQ